jgi:hypothetical protein
MRGKNNACHRIYPTSPDLAQWAREQANKSNFHLLFITIPVMKYWNSPINLHCKTKIFFALPHIISSNPKSSFSNSIIDDLACNNISCAVFLSIFPTRSKTIFGGNPFVSKRFKKSES